MSQILRLWATLPRRQQIFAGIAAFGVFLGVLTLARSTISSDMALLYSGLDPAASGEVLTALDAQGVEYEVRSGAIYVVRATRDRLRMQLAGQGLPANGAAGYELLDGLTGFGTTSQMFDAAYWRAKEGELARTIAAQPGFRSARVHIALSTPRPFQKGQDSSASVTVIPRGGGVTSDQARALRYLIASAAAGLEPGTITVIDGRTGTLIEANEGGPEHVAERAAVLRQNILRLVEARVGVGNAVVEVNVEQVFEQETIVERRFDPSSRVPVRTDSSERTSSSTGSDTPGTVSVSSNLPDGDAALGSNGSGRSSSDTETRETVSFEVSETKREILRAPGAVKRISVAVLVNGFVSEGSGGAQNYREREPQELADLKELVSSAIGFDQARGDTITIRSMALEDATFEGAEPSAGPSSLWSIFASGLNTMGLIQLGVLAFVTLILGLFVVRPLLGSAPAGPALPAPTTETLADRSVDFQRSAGDIALSRRGNEDPSAQVILDHTGNPALVVASDNAPQVNLSSGAPDTALAAGNPQHTRGFDGERGTDEFPAAENDLATGEAVDRLRDLISTRKLEALEVLRGWMDQPVEENQESV